MKSGSTRYRAGLVPLLCCLFFVPMARAQPETPRQETREWSWLSPDEPDSLRRAEFSIWLPASIDDNQPIRGVLGVSDYEAGGTLYEDPAWRRLAEQLHCAILKYDLERPAPKHKLAKDQAAADAIVKATRHFAEQTGRPELAHAPLVLTGLSQGGWQAVALANRMPQRVAAIVSYHEATPTRAPEEGRNPAGFGVPMLHVMGGKCFLTPQIYPWVLESRAKGALKTVILQPGVPHHKMGDQGMVAIWLADVFNQRVPQTNTPGQPIRLADLPADGGPRGSLVIEFAEDAKKGTRITEARLLEQGATDQTSIWLPSDTVAQAWLTYSRTGELPTP